VTLLWYSEPAEGDAREDRQGGVEGGAVAGTAVRRSGRARKQLKVVIGDQIVVTSSQPRP
jgi:hypothetical protein